MKLRSKVLASFIVAILALTAVAGTAFAADKLPAKYEEAAGGAVVDGQTQQNDVWIKVIGGGSVYGNQEIAHATRSVDITFTGNCTFDLQFIYNYDGGWDIRPTTTETVDGELVKNFAMNGAGSTWCEAVLNITNKTEGPLEVTRMEFKDEAGNVLLTVGPERGGASAAATPKTGVVSTALFFGLGAAVLGTGAVVLKKKENE